MCAPDTYCSFCESLGAAYVQALVELPAGGEYVGRERIKHDRPFEPRWCGVTWHRANQRWIARSGKILLGVFSGDEAGHDAAGMTYARFVDPAATAPYPRRKTKSRISSGWHESD